MYELIQVSEHNYYIQCPAKIGLVKLNDTEVCLIDSGSDKDAGSMRPGSNVILPIIRSWSRLFCMADIRAKISGISFCWLRKVRQSL